MKARRPAPSQAPDPLRAAFAADVQQDEDSLARFDAIVEAKDSTEQALAALKKDCAAPLDAMDATAVARRVAQERQIELLVIKIASLEEQLVRLALDLKPVLLRTAETQREFLQPVHAALVEEVSAALRSHFNDPARARLISNETDSVRALARIATAYWVSDALFDPVSTCRKVLPELRAILDGKQPWLD